MLALSSLALSRDSRPKQEILDDLLEQARQVRSGQDGAWERIMSFCQARQHQENEALRQLQNQSALKTASSQILKTAKSLYQFIVPVA